jgi:2-polyprenyl-3-methyl-5-hydroxy-6-metoxy-1,4-benzoquinol methylase
VKQRTQIPDPTIDRLEELWWNQNAETVESVWAQPLIVREAVRNHYLLKAKQFFLQSSTKRPIGVLEVGCGSGWVGRAIAELETIKIIGIDLSERQIEIARRNAIEARIDSACEYHCQNLADFVMSKNYDVSCVLIHAILHHLSWQEIDTLLTQISSLGKNTRVFVYEPVYLGKENSYSQWNDSIYKKLAWLIARLPLMLGKTVLLGKKQFYNQALAKQMQSISKEAIQNNWVLSPKEVIFQETEFLESLSQYFDVGDRYLCNYTSMAIGHLVSMYESSKIYDVFSKTVLPLARSVDNFLFETNLLSQAASNYVFMGYECLVK